MSSNKSSISLSPEQEKLISSYFYDEFGIEIGKIRANEVYQFFSQFITLKITEDISVEILDFITNKAADTTTDLSILLDNFAKRTSENYIA
jgi:hypothetical protein